MRTDVNLTRVNKIETLYGMSGVYVKVEPLLDFHTLPLFHLRTYVSFTCVNSTEKLRDSGNQPLGRSRVFTNSFYAFAPKGDTVKILTPGVLSIKTREL